MDEWVDVGSLNITIQLLLHKVGSYFGKGPKSVPRQLQNHVAWSQTLKCNVKSYVMGLLTKF